MVSTHSRLKAADIGVTTPTNSASFNTQPPEGGCSDSFRQLAKLIVSTHSRLKAAVIEGEITDRPDLFQHTAA